MMSVMVRMVNNANVNENDNSCGGVVQVYLQLWAVKTVRRAVRIVMMMSQMRRMVCFVDSFIGRLFLFTRISQFTRRFYSNDCYSQVKNPGNP